jgi:hypothetical protein
MKFLFLTILFFKIWGNRFLNRVLKHAYLFWQWLMSSARWLFQLPCWSWSSRSYGFEYEYINSQPAIGDLRKWTLRCSSPSFWTSLNLLLNVKNRRNLYYQSHTWECKQAKRIFEFIFGIVRIFEFIFGIVVYDIFQLKMYLINIF